MVQIYRRKWQRGVFNSLLGYLRDSLILALPLKRVPSWIVKILYGTTFRFAFLVHPRAYQDVFISMPAFKFMKFFIRREKGYLLFSKTAPFVLNTITTEQNNNGYVIAQLTVPEIMFEKRKETLRMLEKSMLLVSKICMPGAVVGLGGWFPMISKRGESLLKYAEQLGITVTNGHCGTLASIYMTVEKIARVADMPIESMTLALIGVGKMGSNVARAFTGKVKKLLLIDLNKAQLAKLKNELISQQAFTEIEIVLSDIEKRTEIRDVLRRCHVGICATSSFRDVLKLKDLPAHFIGIDDSRPEALPRDPRKERIILEGGLLKIANAKINYNYGFGEDDNVFGCLGEAFLLSLDGRKILQPTLGDVEMSNFFNLLDFCKKNGVSEGDMRSSDMVVSDDDIRFAIKSKPRSIQES